MTVARLVVKHFGFAIATRVCRSKSFCGCLVCFVTHDEISQIIECIILHMGQSCNNFIYFGLKVIEIRRPANFGFPSKDS